MTLVLVILLIVVFWFVIDFHLGSKKHKMLAQKRQSQLFFGGMEIFSDGRELFHDYFQALQKATSHIHVLFYIVKNDGISHEFLKILQQKAIEGVEVRLLLDWIGCKNVPQTALDALKKAGAEVAYSNRMRLPFLFYSLQVRNHRKISIIDGKVGYLGGFNVAKEYIGLDPHLSPWRDYHLKMTGEGVPFLQREFLTDWKEYFGVDLRNNAVYFPDAAMDNWRPADRRRAAGAMSARRQLAMEAGQLGIPPAQQERATMLSPPSCRAVKYWLAATEAGQLEEYYLQLINRAKTSITIGSPYFVPSEKIFAALLKAARSGISLTVITPGKADHILVQEASLRYLRKLIAVRAKVYQFSNGFYHAKTIIIDHNICVVGTPNFDKRSFFLNKEMICTIDDETFMGRIKEIINQDILDSRELFPSDLNRPGPFGKAKELIAGTISYFL